LAIETECSFEALVISRARPDYIEILSVGGTGREFSVSIFLFGQSQEKNLPSGPKSSYSSC